ncbi:hypothetical protein [Azospirillum sp.]|uniref:hypothetical protein n=1 Tax=Azospirillum sp. TaxID=34012 RepID=UPI002D750AFF|nr:hypothetical protein [Azospirillum sp.]HYD67661.1 hypothetical protein [Azospirillum sp.]
MPIRFDASLAHFEGDCTVEEALPLNDWLLAEKGPAVDLRRCTGLHTALLQLLLATRPALASGPEDPFLARWVAPLLHGPKG